MRSKMKWGDFVIIGAVLLLAGAMLAFFAAKASGDTLYAEVWRLGYGHDLCVKRRA